MDEIYLATDLNFCILNYNMVLHAKTLAVNVATTKTHRLLKHIPSEPQARTLPQTFLHVGIGSVQDVRAFFSKSAISIRPHGQYFFFSGDKLHSPQSSLPCLS